MRHVTAPDRGDATRSYSHREILEILSGLLLGMFVSILSSTVVSNALPTIVHELHGTESGYTWVVTATLLATTIATPIWGKLSDLFSKKLLVQLSLVVFVVASMVAGLSENMGMLIAMRVFQGIGAGGLTALSQVIIATIVPPRERGRYSGYMGATFALATVAGPLIGGAITEHWSWHWCFYVGVPFALVALVVLQRTLHLPTRRGAEAHVDYLGAILLAGGVSALLIWVSLAGDKFDWWSWQTGAMVGGGIVLLALTLMAERIAPEPLIPLRLFRSTTTVLSSAASLFVGIGMFASTVFLGQFFQIARGDSPTKAGLMTMPLIVGMFLSSMVSGQVITRTGKWKAWLVSGGLLLTAGLGLMGTIDYDTAYWQLSIWMFVMGVGIGMMMQNLVLAVQNEVAVSDLGAASSFVAFTRSLGGAIGVSALGAVMAHRVKTHLVEGFTEARINPGKALGGGIPSINQLNEPVRHIVQQAYGQGIAEIFLAAAPFALLAFLITLFIKETRLRTRNLEAGELDQVDVDDEQHWNTPADHTPEERLTRAQWLAREQAGRGQDVGTVAPAAPAAGQSVVARTGSTAAPAPAPVQDVAPVPATPARLLQGQVVRAGGSPVQGARVTLADQTGQQVGRTTTGVDGGYQFDVAHGGTYLLIVAAEGVAPAASLVAVADQGVRHDVLLSGTARLSGRVVQRGAGDGLLHPVPGVQVTLTDVDGQVAGSQRSGADGGYAFDNLTPGGYVITAQGGDHRPLARTVEVSSSDASVCELLLQAGGHLAGEVLAASDHQPVRHATVTLTDATGQVAGTALTGADGSYHFTDLEPGHYVLTAAGYAPVAREVQVLEGGLVQQPVLLGEAVPDGGAENRAGELAGER